MTNSADPRRDVRADNQVFLRGRLAGAAQLRELPSGDVLISFRVTVARPPRALDLVDTEAPSEMVTRWLPAIEICHFGSRKSTCSVGSGPRGRRFKSSRPDQFHLLIY